MDGFDGLLLPSVPIPAHKIGLSSVRIGGADEPVRNVTLRLTQLFNVTGHPAVSIPCGRTPEGLPIGAQLVGRRSGTSDLLGLAGALEPYLGPGTSR
jgi:aspartyl-tRNA(Asn)/glutamyl-tRNA(Gln) amidotransferase subunit A